MAELIDTHTRKIDYLRISVTDRCNLRCVYCMPLEGVKLKSHKEILTLEEIICFARAAMQSGIGRVRLTGGEPLIRKNLAFLIRGLYRIPGLKDLSLTTNALLLKKQLPELIDAGLRRINISIDSLDPETYRQLTRGGRLEDAIAGLEAALEAGLDPVKVNVVVLRGINDQNLEDFAKLTLKYPVHIRFIEHMSFDNHHTSEFFVPGDEVKQKLASLGIMNEAVSPLGAGPAKYYQLPGAFGTIGFILPTTGHFCGECNRLRLTADGRLRTCLFSDDEIDVKSFLRRGASEEELLNLIKEALTKKPKEKFATCQKVKRKMVQIGG